MTFYNAEDAAIESAKTIVVIKDYQIQNANISFNKAYQLQLSSLPDTLPYLQNKKHLKFTWETTDKNNQSSSKSLTLNEEGVVNIPAQGELQVARIRSVIDKQYYNKNIIISQFHDIYDSHPYAKSAIGGKNRYLYYYSTSDDKEDGAPTLKWTVYYCGPSAFSSQDQAQKAIFNKLYAFSANFYNHANLIQNIYYSHFMSANILKIKAYPFHGTSINNYSLLIEKIINNHQTEQIYHQQNILDW